MAIYQDEKKLHKYMILDNEVFICPTYEKFDQLRSKREALEKQYANVAKMDAAPRKMAAKLQKKLEDRKAEQAKKKLLEQST